MWLGLQGLHLPVDFFAMLEALSTAVAAAAVISAGFVAYKELSEISNTRQLEIVNRLFEE